MTFLLDIIDGSHTIHASNNRSQSYRTKPSLVQHSAHPCRPVVGQPTGAFCLEAEMSEIWKPVVEYEGLYEVSSLGRIKSFPKRRNHSKPIILKSSIGSHGYPSVSLLKNGVQKGYTVHSLVLTAFRGPRPKNNESRHLNGIRTDPRLVNLRWGTHRDNCLDRKRHGRGNSGEMHPLAKVTENDVREMRYLRNVKGLKLREIGERFNCTPHHIGMICRRTTWKHI